METENTYKHGGVFTGVGLFEYAAEKAGFKNVFSCEIDAFRRGLIKQNHPTTQIHSDIHQLTTPPYVDVLSGGFPCQDISNAKTYDTNGAFRANGIEGTRSGLWWQMHRVISISKPKFIIAENVPALTKKGLDVVLQSLAQIGYDAEWCTISAAEFGAPHKRERLWIVAYPHRYRREKESIILSKVISEKIQQAPQWQPSRTICKANGKKALPEHYGVHDGNARKLYDAERMYAIGDSIVWVIAYEIFMVIKETLNNQ